MNEELIRAINTILEECLGHTECEECPMHEYCDAAFCCGDPSYWPDPREY